MLCTKISQPYGVEKISNDHETACIMPRSFVCSSHVHFQGESNCANRITPVVICLGANILISQTLQSHGSKCLKTTVKENFATLCEKKGSMNKTIKQLSLTSLCCLLQHLFHKSLVGYLFL